MKRLMFVALMVPAMAHAEFFSGNDLLRRMTSTDVMDRTQAMGYVQGVFDAGQHVKHCAPDNAGITAGQVNDIVKSFLEKNPAIRNFSADLIITDSLKRLWPCVTQNKGRGA